MEPLCKQNPLDALYSLFLGRNRAFFWKICFSLFNWHDCCVTFYWINFNDTLIAKSKFDGCDWCLTAFFFLCLFFIVIEYAYSMVVIIEIDNAKLLPNNWPFSLFSQIYVWISGCNHYFIYFELLLTNQEILIIWL